MSPTERRVEMFDFATLALIASADVVTQCGAIRRRRMNGIDLTTQETQAVALARALKVTTEVERTCVRLRVHSLFALDTTSSSGVGRAFGALRLASQSAADLRILHQTLMSLFPSISAKAVEAVRLAGLEMAGALRDRYLLSRDDQVAALRRIESALRVCHAELLSISTV